MALSDWDVGLGTQTATIIGGDDGSQQANAGLISPLLLQGDDCRDFKANIGTSRDVFFLKKGAEYVNIPDTKAIQVTGWVRKEPVGGNQNAVYLAAKGNAVDGNSKFGGVVLVYGRWRSNGPTNFAGVYTDLSLVIWNTTFQYTINAIGIATLAVDLWHQIRLEVLPVLNGAIVDRDVVRVWLNTGSEASPVWTMLHEEVVFLDELPANPWGAATTRVGWGVGLSGDGVRVSTYIDNVDVRLKTV